MRWRDLEYKDRWMLVTASLQAAAAIGTFLVAMVGIYKVTPIITYTVQRQEAEALINDKALQTDTMSARFVKDVLGWWDGQVKGYEQALQLTRRAQEEGAGVRFEIIAAGGTSIAPELTPDVLVVKSAGRVGKGDGVRVPVNEQAMAPTQYIQCKINQGAFSALPEEQRLAVETAVERYMHRHMLPKVSPPHVRPDMTLQQLHNEIALRQDDRERTVLHIRALKGVIDEALQE